MARTNAIVRQREGQHSALLADGGVILFGADHGRNGLSEDFLEHVFIAREQIPSVIALLGREVIHRNVDGNVND